MGCGGASTKTDQKPTSETLPPTFRLPYRLDKPDDTYKLPKKLTEISGLTYYRNGQLLCVQDEEAVVYVVDTQTGKLAGNFSFGGYGDFEGIEYVNGEVYVLESNGNLFRFAPPTSLDAIETNVASQIKRTKTDLPKKTEVEGLGYDPKTKRLLLAVKEGGDSSGDNTVYSFDLLNRVVFKDMQLSDEQLKQAGISPKDWKPSGMAVHPLTGEWYMLSSVGKRLLITSRQAKIIHSEPLDPALFRQPEGICFAPNGDLYVASEGDGKKGYILKFTYQP